MADLTKETEITTAWTEITAPLALQDGATYIIDVAQRNDPGPDPAVVYWALTDDANPPNVTGHGLKPGNSYAEFESREMTKDAGQRMWMRVSAGTATVAASPA